MTTRIAEELIRLERLTETQRKALLAFHEGYTINTVMQGDVECHPSATAGELGVAGATLMSLNPLGGADPETLECGPILVTYDWGDPGRRYWRLTKLGREVAASLRAKAREAVDPKHSGGGGE